MRVIACLAQTIDGKIAPADTLHYVRLGTDADIEHLHKLREQVDAVLFGASSFRAYPRPRRGLDRDIVPVNVILTQSFNLGPESTFFKNQPPVPTIIASPQPAPEEIKRRYPPHIDWLTFENSDIASLLGQLEARSIQTLMVEGGGEILNLFLKAKAIDELYLTICPILLGGQTTPDLLGGGAGLPGFAFDEAVRAHIKSLKRLGNELYLHYHLSYPDG